jgi:hypothetical protein
MPSAASTPLFAYSCSASTLRRTTLRSQSTVGPSAR